MACFRRWRPQAWLGLWAFTTIVGMVIMLRVARAESLHGTGKPGEDPSGWRKNLLAAFSLIFAGLTVAARFLLYASVHLV